MKFNNIFKGMAIILAMSVALVSYAASGTFNMTIDLSKINNKALTGKNFYFTFKGSKLNDSTHQYFLSFKADGTFDSFVTAVAGTDSSTYSYTQAGPLVTFKNIPNFSGRMYISLNNPMYLTITPDANGNLTIADPSPSAQNDTNYLTIYDKVEFTLDGNNIIWANTTAVDFAAIPSVISVNKGATVGLGITRAKLFQDCTNAFTTGVMPDGSKVNPSVSSAWMSCVLTTTVNSKNAFLRVVAPNQSATFSTTYLNDYISAIWAYYQKKDMQISIDCSELGGDTAATDAVRNSVNANPIFVGSVTSGNYWTFTNDNGKIKKSLVTSVNMVDPKKTTNGIPASNDVFGAANEGPFSGDNHTIKSVITKYLLSAVISGILPIKGNPTLNTAYYTANKKSLFKTSSLVTPTGDNCPWYDLYSAVLHNFGDKIYAFAYDDAMGMDSTVKSPIPATVTYTIGDLSNIVIPDNSHNAASYKTSFGVPSTNALQIQYNGAFYDWLTGKGLQVKGQTIANPKLSARFNIKYAPLVGGKTGTYKEYILDMNIPSNSTLPGCDIHHQGDIMYIGLPALQ